MKTLPCPFCESSQVKTIYCGSCDLAEYYVLCIYCRCHGPIGNTKKEAKKLWGELHLTKRFKEMSMQRGDVI